MWTLFKNNEAAKLKLNSLSTIVLYSLKIQSSKVRKCNCVIFLYYNLLYVAIISKRSQTPAKSFFFHCINILVKILQNSAQFCTVQKIHFTVYCKLTPHYFSRLSTVKPLITNTSEEFIKCRLNNFSMSFILYYVNFSICENK